MSKDGVIDCCLTYVNERAKRCALPCAAGIFCRDDRSEIEFSVEKTYEPYVRREIASAAADVLVLFYKYRFFSKRLSLPLLDSEEKRLLLTALVSADFSTDKSWAEDRLRGLRDYALDGIYGFRLKELKTGWEKIASYVDEAFSSESLHSFLRYLASEGEGRVFLSGESAYDDSYRPLKKSLLLGEYSAEGEILLSGTRLIYCFGSQSEHTREFLKKYYREKTFFC